MGTNTFNKLGPLSTSIFLLTTTYTIFKHRFLDIDIIKKSFIYVSLITAIATVVSGTIFTSTYLLEQFFAIPPLVNYIAASILVVFAYPKIKAGVDYFTDHVFFQKPYDLAKTIKELGQALSELSSKKDIYRETLLQISDTIPVKNISIYDLTNTDRIRIGDTTGDIIRPKVTISKSSHTMDWCDTFRCPAVKDEIVYQLNSGLTTPKTEKLFTGLINEMDTLNAVMIIPMIQNDKVTGLISFGQKKSDDSYTSQDIDQLQSITQHVATALQSARHHAQVQSQIKKLEDLNTLSSQVGGTFNNRFIDRQIANMIVELFDFSMVVILHKVGTNLRPNHIYGTSMLSPYNYEIPITQSLEEKLQSTHILHHDEALSISQCSEFWDMTKEFVHKPRLALVPLRSKGEIIGAFICVSDTREKSVDLLDQVLPIIGEKAAAAMITSELFSETKRVKQYNDDVLSNMTAGIMTLNKDLTIVDINDNITKIVYLDAATAVGKKITKFTTICPDFDRIKEILTIGEPMTIEGWAHVDNGAEKRRPIAMALDLVILPNQDIGILCTLTDLSSVYNLKRQLEQSNRLATVGGMAAGISHEIKNTLVSISAFGQMFPTKWQDPEFRSHLGKTVMPQVDRINELAQSLAKFGKPTIPTIQEIKIRETLDSIVTLLHAETRKQNATIELNVDEDIIIMADDNMMAQTFLNLIMNAMQAGKGNPVTVTVNATFLPDTNYYKFDVIDTGCGMSKAVLNKIFQQFFTTKDKDGTGLGLAIVKEIIHNHKGHIHVTSEEGKGTTFCVYLPGKDIKNI